MSETTKVKSSKRVAIMTEKWKDPEYRKRRLEALQGGRARRNAERAAAREGTKDPPPAPPGDGDPKETATESTSRPRRVLGRWRSS